MPVLYKLHRNGDIVQFTPAQHVITEEFARQYGLIEKTFKGQSLYRMLSGAACELWDSKVNKPIFVTLTTKDHVNQKDLNKCLSNYLDNLKANYRLHSYLWLSEPQKNGNTHYHSIMDIPYVPVFDLNRAWNICYKDFSRPSPNALRFPPEWGAVIQSRTRVVKYVCKYISKTNLSSAKNYSCSRHLVKKPLYLDEITFRDVMERHWFKTKQHEHTTVYYTKNSSDVYTNIEKRMQSDLRGYRELYDLYGIPGSNNLIRRP